MLHDTAIGPKYRDNFPSSPAPCWIYAIFPVSQVRSFFTLCWRQSPVLFDELGYLRDVHGPLRARILRHVGSQIRPQLPILQARAPCSVQYGNLNIQT
jgi:hypothetical protein